MQRRNFLMVLGGLGAMPMAVGCRGHQYGHVLKKDAPNLVGSHDAGAEVFDPLVDEAVAKLLGRQATTSGRQATTVIASTTNATNNAQHVATSAVRVEPPVVGATGIGAIGETRRWGESVAVGSVNAFTSPC